MTDFQSSGKVKNVADLLCQSAQAWPDATAVIHPEGSLTYRELNEQVLALCRQLHHEGLRPGAVVGIHVRDTLPHLAWLLALARSGMPCVPVLLSAGMAAAQKILDRTAAHALITDVAVNLKLPTILQSKEWMHSHGTEDSLTPASCEDASRIFVYKSSSGTTGTPKLIASSHADMLASVERERQAIGYPQGERYMTPVDISHDGPRRRFLACLASGGTLVLPPAGADATTLLELMDRLDVSHFSCVPVQAYQLAKVMASRQRSTNLRCLRLSAGPSDTSLHNLLRQHVTPNILVSYGCTEIGPMTVASPELLASVEGTVGVPMPGVEVEIVDAQDRAVSVGMTGQVRIRTAQMPHAYHDDPANSARSFKSGWFYPGDVGRLDASGRLFHLGRADDMMIFNGINIAPVEIERVMLAHPAVADAVAMPLKRAIVHEVPICAVALGAGLSVSSDELMTWARQRLGIRSPKHILLMDPIPRNPMGKPLRTRILQELTEWLSQNPSTPHPKK